VIIDHFLALNLEFDPVKGFNMVVFCLMD